MRSFGVSPADMETAAASANPRAALQDLAERSFRTRHASITRQAMAIPGAVQTTPAAAEALLASACTPLKPTLQTAR
jgi:hypothetical protein